MEPMEQAGQKESQGPRGPWCGCLSIRVSGRRRVHGTVGCQSSADARILFEATISASRNSGLFQGPDLWCSLVPT